MKNLCNLIVQYIFGYMKRIVRLLLVKHCIKIICQLGGGGQGSSFGMYSIGKTFYLDSLAQHSPTTSYVIHCPAQE